MKDRIGNIDQIREGGMTEQLFCKQQDRDVPEIICGYPLPCPWHTTRIDMTTEPPEITIPVTPTLPVGKEELERLKRVALALKDPAELVKPKKKRRKKK